MDDWRRALSIILTILLAIASLSLGALAWTRTTSYNLPTPTWIPATATLFSPILGLLLATLSSWLATNASTTEARFFNLSIKNIFSALNQLHTILSTILATLALAYLYPERISTCNIEQQWQAFFHAKNADAIRSIQDSLQCCGLRSTRDRAWPFKDREHGDNACEAQMGYTRSCIVPWAGQQRRVSWMVFVCVLLGVVIKIGVLSWNGRRSSWMRNSFQAEEQAYRRITNETTADAEAENQRDLSACEHDDEMWRE